MAKRRVVTDAGLSHSAHFTFEERRSVEHAPLSLYELRVTGARVGLQNHGNTCYMNSLLQTLAQLPPFYNAIIGFQHDPSTHGPLPDSIPAQLQLLFAHLTHSERRAVPTDALTKSFQWSPKATAEDFKDPENP